MASLISASVLSVISAPRHCTRYLPCTMRGEVSQQCHVHVPATACRSRLQQATAGCAVSVGRAVSAPLRKSLSCIGAQTVRLLCPGTILTLAAALRLTPAAMRFVPMSGQNEGQPVMISSSDGLSALINPGTATNRVQVVAELEHSMLA